MSHIDLPPPTPARYEPEPGRFYAASLMTVMMAPVWLGVLLTLALMAGTVMAVAGEIGDALEQRPTTETHQLEGANP